MKYLLIACLLSTNAYALSDEDKEMQEICTRNRTVYYFEYDARFGVNLHTDITYDPGFASCDKIMDKIGAKEVEEKAELKKLDMKKVAKYTVKNNCEK